MDAIVQVVQVQVQGGLAVGTGQELGRLVVDGFAGRGAAAI